MNSAKPNPRKPHIPELDGLRGLAILLVFAGHTAQFGSQYSETTNPLMSFLGRNTGLGVDLFFVLSGFLITGLLYDAKESSGYFRTFYARRTLRIFPLYYATLAIVAALKFGFPDVFALKTLTSEAQWANWTYTSNILIALKDWGSEPGYLGHFWSLAVEEQFYVVWPVVVLAIRRERLIQTCWAGILVAFVARIIFFRQLRRGLHASSSEDGRPVNRSTHCALRTEGWPDPRLDRWWHATCPRRRCASDRDV